MSLIIAQGPLAVPLAELKAYLRITLPDEDAALERLIHAATAVAERTLGLLCLRREVVETLPVRSGWQRLAAEPVSAITMIEGVPADGPVFALPPHAYAIDIDANGCGLVRIHQPGAAGRVRVTYEAGLAADMAALPVDIGHGIVRLAGEYHARREGLETEPPASVMALWRPWRRVRLA